MFANLSFTHDAHVCQDVLSFDMTEAMLARLWDVFAVQRRVVDRIGSIARACMYDGYTGEFLAIEGLGGNIFASVEEGRLFVQLWPELDPADPGAAVPFEQNWVRFVPVLRWLREVMA